MQVWPAIDLRGGKCVRLKQGDYGRETVFGDDPTDMARRFVQQGAQRLHLVDLDGARSGNADNRAAILAIAKAVDVPCQTGGGVRDEQSISELLQGGVAQLVVGTKALSDPDWLRSVCRRYPNQLVLGIDARGGNVAVEGWTKTSTTSAVDFARHFQGEPLAAVVYTDIATDGMMSGPNTAAMAEMSRSVHLPIIASGGVSSVEDVRGLAAADLHGCIIGRALYEGALTIQEAIQAAENSTDSRANIT